MKEIKLIIKTNTEKYPVIIGSNLIQNLSKIIKKNSIRFNKCLVVFDKNVPKEKINIVDKSLKNKKVYFHPFYANEINKNQKSIETKIIVTIIVIT